MRVRCLDGCEVKAQALLLRQQTKIRQSLEFRVQGSLDSFLSVLEDTDEFLSDLDATVLPF